MALRKEEFHYDPYEKKPVEQAQSAKRQRMTIDISAALIERIQVAASQQNLSVDQYLEDLLDKVLRVQPVSWVRFMAEPPSAATSA